MASYRGHLMFSSALGAAYGSIGVYRLHYDWGEALLGAGLAAVGGLLPDLDSDSGVPVRELFGLAAALIPLMLYSSIRSNGYSVEQTFVLLGGVYILIRYFLSNIFRRWTVHRGMFHSVPAMLISGLVTFLIYHSPNMTLRYFLSVGVMVGFLSHLVLDEVYSVDFMGVAIRLNKYAGSAVKLFSPSILATVTCYVLLGGFGFLAWKDWTAQKRNRGSWNAPWPSISSTGSGRPTPAGGR